MFYRMTILSGKMNFAGKTNPFHFARAGNNFLLHRIYGSPLSPGKRSYSLSSQLVDRKASHFVKGKSFELFPSEICRVQTGELWLVIGERSQIIFYKELLCLASSDIMKQSSSTRDGFLSSDA